MKTLVDNFSVLSIEKCLLQKLPEMFTPEIVIGLDDAQIEGIASESEESRAERSRATEKLQVLEETLNVLRSLDRHKITGKSLSCLAPFPGSGTDRSDITSQRSGSLQLLAF